MHPFHLVSDAAHEGGRYPMIRQCECEQRQNRHTIPTLRLLGFRHPRWFFGRIRRLVRRLIRSARLAFWRRWRFGSRLDHRRRQEDRRRRNRYGFHLDSFLCGNIDSARDDDAGCAPSEMELLMRCLSVWRSLRVGDSPEPHGGELIA
jgi:hypothetical protein